eukprot:scaffold1912_cov167-Amphora_coffeaeformis.AAC.31
MKTSTAILFIASLLILGEVQGFSQAGKQQLGSRHTVASSSTSTSSSRLFHRPIFNPKQELLNNRHSASDWLYNVKSLPQSGVLREIRKPVMAAFVWACIVSIVQMLLLASKLGPLRTFATKTAIPTSAHSFLVSSLGLLLVFRTNSAYQRFNARRTQNLGTHPERVSKHDSVNYAIFERTYPYLLRHHIRPGCLCVDDFCKIDPEYRLMLREPKLMAVETRHDGDKQSLGGSTESQAVWQQRRECWVDRRKLPWSLFPESALQKVAKARNRPLWALSRPVLRGFCSIGYSIEDPFQGSLRLSLLCDAIRRDVMDASSEGLSEDGRDSAYALEGSQAIDELEKPMDLINALSNGTHFETTFLSDVANDTQIDATQATQQSVDFSGDTVIIDPNLINPPQFIQRDGKLFVTSRTTPAGVSGDLDA